MELWNRGAKVVAVSNNSENLHNLKKEYPTIEIKTVHLENWMETRQIIGSLGHFDGVVNNAGIISIQPFLECSVDNFEASV